MKRKHNQVRPTVMLEIENGLVEVTGHRGGPCRLIVKDFDVEGMAVDGLARDAAGRVHRELVFDL